MKDYYKTLGIEKNASKDDIKKAFRKMAHQYHPDKNKNDPAAAQKFKEASEAYSVLSDDNRRRQYDTFGSASPGGAGFSGNQGGFNPNDFGGFDFSGFQQGGGQGFEFDLGDIFGDLFGGKSSSRRAAEARGRDISVDMTISFEESIFGADKTLVITKTSKCPTCGGSGAEQGSGMEKCKVCGGKGRINETRRSFIGVFNTTRVCDNCHGMGEVPTLKCQTCHGSGVAERPQEIEVSVPPGIEDGQRLRLSGMGEAVPFGVSGDLYVRIGVRPHPFIAKEGVNLSAGLDLKLTQAITGATVNLKTLDGDIELKIPEGTNNGDILRLKGKGVPNERGRRGDFLVKIKVIMPKKLSREAKEAIQKLRNEGY